MTTKKIKTPKRKLTELTKTGKIFFVEDSEIDPEILEAALERRDRTLASKDPQLLLRSFQNALTYKTVSDKKCLLKLKRRLKELKSNFAKARLLSQKDP
jgi:hypothetical protein